MEHREHRACGGGTPCSRVRWNAAHHDTQWQCFGMPSISHPCRVEGNSHEMQMYKPKQTVSKRPAPRETTPSLCLTPERSPVTFGNNICKTTCTALSGFAKRKRHKVTKWADYRLPITDYRLPNHRLPPPTLQVGQMAHCDNRYYRSDCRSGPFDQLAR